MGEVFYRDLVDLFGDPVPVSRGKRGRPAHVPTAENRRFVQLSLASDYTDEQIATDLRITVKTLHRHYFHELAGRESARRRLKMKNLSAIVAGADAGKTAAQALLAKTLERFDQRETAGRYQQRAPTVAPLGKKEAAKVAAAEVEGKYAPRQQPRLLN